MKTESFLRSKELITALTTTVGQSSEDGFGATQSTPYKAESTVTMIPEKERPNTPSDLYAASLKKDISKMLTGVKVKTTPVNIFGTADRAAVDLVVTGTNQDSAMKFAKLALNELSKVDGATSAKLSVEEGSPEVHVSVDRDKMAALGLSMDVIGGTMQTAFTGTADDGKMKFRQGEYEYDINLRYSNFNRKNADDVRNITFVNGKGQNIKLSEFASVTDGSGPSRLERRDKLSSVDVQSQVIGRPSGDVTTDFLARVGKLKKPAGVNYLVGGDAENQGDSNSQLGVALLLSVILMYLIMVALYDNYIRPMVVMFSLPLSLIGAFLALALTNNTLNIFSIMGIIMLFGLVAKNAIMLVDFANQSKEEGYDTDEALVRANHARLRPILMTTIAMVIGMLPIALAGGGVAAIKHGLAWVIIGGLISSMFLTLIVVPVIYKITDRLMERFGWGSVAKKRLVQQRITSNVLLIPEHATTTEH
jgi:HAE1 family hydrophobic/amphiphilic exporter-1